MGLCNRIERRIYTEKREGVSVVEREEIHEFIKEQLRKDYIKPSKLSQMAPLFFIKKKDGKRRIVQDY